MQSAHKRSYGTSQSSKTPPSRNQMLIGLRPLMEAIEAGKEIDRVFIQRGIQGEIMLEVKALIKQHQVPFQYVPIEKLNRISSKNHQGIIAFVSPVTFGNFENIVAAAFESGEIPRLLMLDGVTDVRNFGAICRSAECFGAHAVIIPEKGSAQINEEAIKTSAGALYNIPVCRVRSIAQAVKQLQESGITVVACSEKTSKDSYDADLRNPICLVMGSEELGVSNDILRIADEIIRIPMTGKTSSLNVSVAAGIALYEIIRQQTGNSTSGNARQ
jgi:23S rRNA (guanosine2251-2'-O)-methyltransferase